MQTSPSIGAIAAALAKAQGEMKNATRDAANPYFKSKYAPLDTVIDAIKGALSKNGIAYVQSVASEANHVRVTTRFIHTSGEWIESDPMCADAKDAAPQSIGSATTFLRRYSLQSAAGIAATDDDDAEQAQGRDTPAGPVAKPQSAVEKVKAKVQAANGKADPARQILGEAIVVLGTEQKAKEFLRAVRGEKAGTPISDDELTHLRDALAARKQHEKNTNDAAAILGAH